jgi:hypothetical protein
MTPEEKQAIIDKALELGFILKEREFYILKSEIGFFNLFPCTSTVVFEVETYDDSVILKYLETPEQLETLFNAIVS